MRKAIMAMFVVTSICMLVSSACAVPHVTYNEVKRAMDEKVEKAISAILESKAFKRLEKVTGPSDNANEARVEKALSGTQLADVPYFPKLCELLSKISAFIRYVFENVLKHRVLLGIFAALLVVVPIALTVSTVAGIAKTPVAFVTMFAVFFAKLSELMDGLQLQFMVGPLLTALIFICAMPIILILAAVATPIPVIAMIADNFANIMLNL